MVPFAMAGTGIAAKGQPSYDEAVGLLADAPGPDLDVVRADDWEEGMGASLRAGLRHLLDTTAQAAVVTLVDLPDVGGDAITLLDRHVARAIDADETVEGDLGEPCLGDGRDAWQGCRRLARRDRNELDAARLHRGADDGVCRPVEV